MATFTKVMASTIAADLQCEIALIRAFAQVESGGRKDLPDGRPQILFEAQWFHNFTGGIYDNDYPNISSPYWNQTLYVGGAGEYSRLAQAMALDRVAALKSASWGIFQIMGFNHARCGFPDVSSFVEFVKGPDDNDMLLFSRFCAASDELLGCMRTLNFPCCARLYNGTGQVPKYSAELETDYNLFKAEEGAAPIASPFVPLKMGSKGPAVAALQKSLGSWYPWFPDSDYGPKTYNAVALFQASQSECGHTDGVGVAGALTLKALEAR